MKKSEAKQGGQKPTQQPSCQCISKTYIYRLRFKKPKHWYTLRMYLRSAYIVAYRREAYQNQGSRLF